MEYKVIITSKARSEIGGILEYISVDLKNKSVARKLKNKIKESIKSLKFMPKRFTKIDLTDKFQREYYRVLVDNYAILYNVDDENHIVYIVHIYYSKKNYLKM